MVNRIGGFVLIFLFFFTFSLRGEGTAQILSSDAGHGKLQVMSSFSDFGLYDKDPEYRLHVRVANVGEVIYYGFGDRLDNNDQTISNVYYRITDPNGTVVVPETLLTSSGAGYIDTYSKAVAGPLQVVGSGGYNAKSLVAAWQGDYYLEFRYTGFWVDRCKFKYFDITVATPTNVAIPGRVWSQGWQFTADNFNFPFQGKLYVYSDDGIVTSIKFNNMQPFVFTVFCNQNGTDPGSTNWQTNRKSKVGKYYAPQYKIFLNNPNNDLTNPTYTFPTGALGEITPPILLASNCNGTGIFTVNVTKPGKVILLLDIDPTPGVQPVDVEIPFDILVAGVPYDIPWNGLNGLGQPVVNGTSIPVSVTYINGLTNLPIFDVEASPNGFIVELIRPKPTGTPDPPVEWDDTDIWGGGQSPTGGCNYVLPNGCHTWTSTVGESNTVNTWWYTASSSMVAAEPFIMKRVPQPLGNITGAENAFCAGSAGKSFSVTPDPNSTTYTWSYTGGDYVVNGTGPAVTINFGASSVSGNLTVVGNNISCGTGATPSPAFPITIVPGPVVSVTPDAIDVCSDEPAFALTGGSPSGGVYTEGGIPLTTFDPQTATPGVHTITYTYSTPPPTVCTGSSTLSITVNPAPVVALSTFPDVCINAAPFILANGTPVGGIYTGDGVAAGSFSPAAAGVGTHLITYQYTTSEGCSNDATGPILVLPLPGAAGAILPATPEICQGSTQLYSTAVIADATGYQWSVTPLAAASDISLDPASHNLATITWDAAYTGNAVIHVMGQNGCGDGLEASQTLTIRPNPVVTAKTCDNIVTTTEGRLIRMNWGLPLGGSYTGDGINTSNGLTFDPKNAGGAGVKTITYTVTNQFLCSASADAAIQVFDPPPFVQCGTSTILDVRTNTSYKTFLSGSGASAKCWMARNLDIGTMITEGTPQTDNCVAEKYCWLADAAQCTANGALFQWDELIQYEDPAIGYYQDLCIPGWHVATAAEWQSLIDANQGAGQAGGYLKDVTPTGFDLLLRGVLYLNYLWAYIPTETITGSLLWTSTRSGEKVIARGFNVMNPSVSLYESSRANAFPVRCVKDN